MISKSLARTRRNLSRHRLATALLCALASASAAAASAQPDSSWIRVRTDASRRLFPALPAPTKIGRDAAGGPHIAAVVDNCNDDGPGSLRAAVAAATDSDTIDLTQLQCSTITLTTGAIEVDLDNLAFEGPGREKLAIDGNHVDRVFIHPYGGTLTFKALTVRNGHDRATGFHVAGGGCIASGGYVQLYDTTVRDCYAGGEGAYGGAIYGYSLTMTRSTLTGNHAYGIHDAAGTAAFGGAGFVYSLHLYDSTVSANLADHRANPGFTSYDIGGAFVAIKGGNITGSTIDHNIADGRAGGVATFNPLAVANSTISANTARTDIAGGLFLRWPSALQLDNSTITGNVSALDGGGIWLNAPDSSIRSSIVFGNSTDIGNDDNRYGSAQVVSVVGSNNIVGTSSALLALPADTRNVDPKLRPLNVNGGPTRTHALSPDSPVIDAGINPLGFGTDQRGITFARSYGAAPDIGAYETQAQDFEPPAPPTQVPALSRTALGVLFAAMAVLALRGSGRRDAKRLR